MDNANVITQQAACFNAFDEELASRFEYYFLNPMSRKTIVIIPSLSFDPEMIAKLTAYIHYEERMLCMLNLLQMPNTHVVYLSSLPIDEAIIDYYLFLLFGTSSRQARQRLTLLNCSDSSNRPLTDKVLERHYLIAQIRQSIPPDHIAYLEGYNITYREQELASRLAIPLYGCPVNLSYWGTKSGSREIFRRLGLPLLPGYENLKNMRQVAEVLGDLKREYPRLTKAVVKLNEGTSGAGNAVYCFQKNSSTPDEDNLRKYLNIIDKYQNYDIYSENLNRMGGIVEAFLEKGEKRTPSVQCQINPLKQIKVLSTHDQVMDEKSGHAFMGCRFPADLIYAREISEMGFSVANEMSRIGVIGSFSLDFISTKINGRWEHYALEINLRKGGATHPYLMLQSLTNGNYDYNTCTYSTLSGSNHYYFATDNLQSDAYKGITPNNLIDIAICHGIHFDVNIQEGVIFHLLGALPEYGKVGLVCIGSTPERVQELYQTTIRVLDARMKKEYRQASC